jgi:hypothetical protein
VVPGVNDAIRNLGRGERDGDISVELLVTTVGDFEVIFEVMGPKTTWRAGSTCGAA